MRSVLDIGMIASGWQKFQSPKGDSTFTITHGAMTFVVDVYGNVISPAGTSLDFLHSDPMVGNQTGFTGTVKDFITVDPSMDSPGSHLW